MNEKKNSLEIIRFGKPDRIVSHWPEYNISYHGVDHEGYEAGSHNSAVGCIWEDIWQTKWRKELDGVMGFPIDNPLSDTGKLAPYHWPDPDDERICGKIYSLRAKYPNGDLFIGGSHRETLWEKAQRLVGMAQLMEYFFTEPDFVREIFHRIMDFQLGIARHYLKLGVELISMGDDLGTQKNLLLSPAIIREFLVPEYSRLFDLYRQHGVIVNFHSCGHIEPVLNIFIDLGVNILNPIQATANNLASVRKITQGKIALLGGISSDTMMKGPAEKIREEVRRVTVILGGEGGYFCAPDQSMPWPKKHYEAFQIALEEYGKYPMRS